MQAWIECEGGREGMINPRQTLAGIPVSTNIAIESPQII